MPWRIAYTVAAGNILWIRWRQTWPLARETMSASIHLNHDWRSRPDAGYDVMQAAETTLEGRATEEERRCHSTIQH
jgi:hypothetical protein